MTKVVTIGGATQDIFIRHDDPLMIDLQVDGVTQSFLALREGAKVEVQNLDYHTGGGATNSAVSFSKLGLTTSCCIKTGDDDQARHIVKQLKSMGIMVHQSIDAHMATGTSFILPTKSKDRVALVWRGANTQLKQSDIAEKIIVGNDCVYITSLSHAAAALFLPIAQRVKKLGKKVATNPGTSQLTDGADVLIKSLSYVDILIVNSHEAQLCMGSLIEQHDVARLNNTESNHTDDTPELVASSYTYKDVRYSMRDFFRAALQFGPEIIVVTNGKEGVYVGTKDVLLFHPSLPTNIINTLGAGDAFGSCFVAQLLQDKDIKTAMLAGLLNAQSVIEHLDAKSGILTAEQLQQKMEKQSLNALQKFNI